MSFFPSLPTKGNKFDLNTVLLKCFQALGVNSDTDSNNNNNNNNLLCVASTLDAESVLIKT